MIPENLSVLSLRGSESGIMQRDRGNLSVADLYSVPMIKRTIVSENPKPPFTQGSLLLSPLLKGVARRQP